LVIDQPFSVVWTEYFKHRVELRGFELHRLEEILRYSNERYYDTVTHRMVVVGRHGDLLVVMPYDTHEQDIVPVTVHATSRQQIGHRLKTGRFTSE
jgi:hypothetical protein